MFLVLKHENGRDVAINSDGTTSTHERGELFATEKQAVAVAKQFGGVVQDERRIFGDDDDIDDED